MRAIFEKARPSDSVANTCTVFDFMRIRDKICLFSAVPPDGRPSEISGVVHYIIEGAFQCV